MLVNVEHIAIAISLCFVQELYKMNNGYASPDVNSNRGETMHCANCAWHRGWGVGLLLHLCQGLWQGGEEGKGTTYIWAEF